MTPLTIDFETSGIRANPIWDPPHPVGVSIKKGGEPSRYLAWGHPTENNCTFEEARRELLTSLHESGGEFIAHNSAFESSILEKTYVWIQKDPLLVHDTMFLLFLTDPYASSFALKPSAERILGLPPDEQTDLKNWILSHVRGALESNWGTFISHAPGDLVGRYAEGDTDRTFLLYEKLYPKVVEYGMVEAYQREQRLMPILSESSRRGVRIDIPRLTRDYELYLGAQKKAEEYIHSVLGEFELSKDAQLAERLDQKGLVTDWVMTPTGKRSVARKNLVGRVKDPLLLDYLAYHGILTTCLGTFAGPWLVQAENECGRVHPQWNQVRGDRGSDGGVDGTRTGRMSCIAKGERVLTKRGEVPIEEVVVGDYVFTHLLRWRAVVATITNGQRPVLKYSLSNGRSVMCTDDHKFYDGSVWLPISEFCDECIQGVAGSRVERRIRTEDLQGHINSAVSGSDCRVDEYWLSQHFGSSPYDARRGETDTEEHEIFSNEVGGSEPNVRKERLSTPQLHRRLRGYLCDEVSWGPKASGSQTDDRRGAWDGSRDSPHEPDSAPHRRESSEQQLRQSGSVYKQGTSADPQADGKSGSCFVEVTSVQFIGVREVYDLTVAEDHSFGIAGVFAHNCKAPNLQNIPTDFEDLRVPEGLPPMIRMRQYLLPEEGHVWLKRDFSAQEMRILAHYMGGRLCDAFQADPNTDPHQAVKEMIDGLIGGDMPRKFVKITGFGILYGRGVPALSSALGVSEIEGKEIRDAYYSALPEIRDLSSEIRSRGRRGQFIRTWGGRLYYREPNLERDLSYKLLNYLDQGSAADQTKQVMIDWNSARSLDSHLIAAVHDEVNMSAPIREKESAMKILREQMDADRFDVPMRSEGFSGPNWSEIERYEDQS